MPDSPEFYRSDEALTCPTNDSGREALFGLLVPVGLVRYVPDGGCCWGELGGGCGELTVTSGIIPPCPDPESCGVAGGWYGVEGSGPCKAWESGTDEATFSISVLPRPDQPNFSQAPDLSFIANGRFQMMTSTVSSSTPASVGPAARQNRRKESFPGLSPNSFMVCMPKY